MIANASGTAPISITGLGVLRARARGHERRAREDRRHLGRVDPGRAPASASGGSPPTEEALSDICAARGASGARARGRRRRGHRPADRRDGDAGHVVPVDGGDPRRPARRGRRGRYDLSPAAPASCTRSRRRTGCSPRGSAPAALVVGGDVLSQLIDWSDRSTCVLFGDGAGRGRARAGRATAASSASSSAPTARGGLELSMPAGGSRMPATAETVANGLHFVHMNGREVFKFATRVLVSLRRGPAREDCGVAVEDVDVYVPAPGERPDHRSCRRRSSGSRRNAWS